MPYKKDNHLLDVSDKFVYLEEIFLMFPNRFELLRSRRYYSSKLIVRKNDRVFNKDLGCHIIRDWELEAAPKQYLISNGYKLV